ncbi:MAG: PAS domain-containing protein [Chloroflexota bacterium]
MNNQPNFADRIVAAVCRFRGAYRLFAVPVLLITCTLIYYAGEIIDFFQWDALQWSFFYSVHDVHRLLFLAPILYASYFGRVRGAAIVTLASFAIFLPRAFLISPYPDPLIRPVLFVIIAGTMGYLTAFARNEYERRLQMENLLTKERDKMMGILNRVADGVVIIGPDYRIRYMNPAMVREFGEGVGGLCYQKIRHLDRPCAPECRLPQVLNGQVEKWQYTFSNGLTFELLASPYVDADGVVCQLATYRDITNRVKP